MFEEKLQFRCGGREKTQGEGSWRIDGIYQKISLVDSREDDGQQLKNFFSHSLVFFSVISVANSAARMLFLSSFGMPPLVCEPSIIASFLLRPQDAPVSPRLIFFITIQAERTKKERFSSCCDICFCFVKGSHPQPVSFLAR